MPKTLPLDASHRLPLLTLTIALLSGCASGLSKNECRLADWHAIGYEDGLRGLPEAQISDHRKACAEHGIGVGFDDFLKGWHAGVRRFCLPGNGYREGRSGHGYKGVCPADLEADFLDAYEEGRQLHAMKREIRRISRALKSKRDRVRVLEAEIQKASNALVADATTKARRIDLLEELRALEHEQDETDAEIVALELDLEAKKRRLATADKTAAY